MKKLICFISFLLPLMFAISVHAEKSKKLVVKIPELNLNVIQPKRPEIKCPYARYMWNNPAAADECWFCHSKPSMKLFEARPDEDRFYPNGNTSIVDGKGYLMLWQPHSENTQAFFRYINWHRINHVIVEIHSPGGALFDAWKVIGLIEEWKVVPGRIVETRVYGAAASSGSLIFMAGTKGHRYVSPHSQLMFHELWKFDWYKTSTPSGAEDEAAVLRHLQDNVVSFIVERCKLTKDEVDTKVRHKEFWMTGRQAVKLGIADKIIGD